MDNQQERLAVACAWMAGMIDADGCLTFLTNHRYKGRVNHQPLIDIATSCEETVDVLNRTIKMIGTSCWISKRYKNRVTVQIRVSGFKRIQKFLGMVAPYLVTKQREAKLMLEWIASREQQCQRNKPYTEKEIELYESIKNCKKTRILRDYTPNILWLKGEDIVQTTSKDDR